MVNSTPPSASPASARDGAKLALVPDPAAAADDDLLGQFRRGQQVRPLTPAQRRFVWCAGLQLTFLPWAVGTMHLWSQLVSAALAVLTFAAVPVARVQGWSGVARRLARWPLFWLGLLWLAYTAIGGLNPATRWVQSGPRWWLVPVEYVAWLPASVDVPWTIGGPWRVLLIHGAAFVFGCAVWLAAERRRVGRALLLMVAMNGMLIAAVGLAQRLHLMPFPVDWLRPADAGPLPGYAFGTFVYKNHAGAYLLVALIAAVGLAGWYHEQADRSGEKSNPSGLLALGALVMLAAIVVSHARGATLTALALVLLWLVGFVALAWRRGGFRLQVALLAVGLAGGLIVTSAGALDYGAAWDRMEQGLADGGDRSLESRRAATAATLRLAADHRGWGSGAGSFPFVFPPYTMGNPLLMGPDPSRPLWWQQAHNDPVQVWAEYGVVGSMILATAILIWLVPALRPGRYLQAGDAVLLTGFVAVLVYSSFDFPLQCPAVLVSFLAIPALGNAPRHGSALRRT